MSSEANPIVAGSGSISKVGAGEVPNPMIHQPHRREPEFSVVVPLFNEEANLGSLHARLSDALSALAAPYELVFVDDGSFDGTPALLERLARSDPRLVVVRLSRNFGHQAAVSAGLDHATGRAVVVMDGDLQDPPEVLPEFVRRWYENRRQRFGATA